MRRKTRATNIEFLTNPRYRGLYISYNRYVIILTQQPSLFQFRLLIFLCLIIVNDKWFGLMISRLYWCCCCCCWCQFHNEQQFNEWAVLNYKIGYSERMIPWGLPLAYMSLILLRASGWQWSWCGLVTSKDDIDRSQHCLMQWLAAWRHQAIIWINADFSLVRFTWDSFQSDCPSYYSVQWVWKLYF